MLKVLAGLAGGRAVLFLSTPPPKPRLRTGRPRVTGHSWTLAPVVPGTRTTHCLPEREGRPPGRGVSSTQRPLLGSLVRRGGVSWCDGGRVVWRCGPSMGGGGCGRAVVLVLWYGLMAARARCGGVVYSVLRGGVLSVLKWGLAVYSLPCVCLGLLAGAEKWVKWALF